MATELRQSKHYTIFLSGSITVRNNKNQAKKAEACAGRFITISRHERDVLLSQAILESDKVNSAINIQDLSSLNIRENIPSAIDTYQLTEEPIWSKPSQLEKKFFINVLDEKTKNITEPLSRA